MNKKPVSEYSLADLPRLWFNPQTASAPYADAAEQSAEWLRLIDMLCMALLICRERRQTTFMRGDLGLEGDLVSLPEPESLQVPLPGFPEAWMRLFTRGLATYNESGVELPLQRIIARLPLTPFALFCVLLAAAPDLNCRYERLFGVLLNDSVSRKPTLGLAADLFALIAPLGEDDIYAALYEEPLALLLAPFADQPEHSRLNRVLALNPPTLCALAEAEALCAELAEFCEFVMPGTDGEPLLAHEDSCGQIARLLASSARGAEEQLRLVHLYGRQGAGKRFVLKRAAAELGVNLLIADCTPLLRLPPQEAHKALRLAACSCALTDALLCLDKFEITRENEQAAREILSCLRRYLSMAVITCEEMTVFKLPDGCVSHAVPLSPTSLAEQNRLWEHFIAQGQYVLAPDVDISRVVLSNDLPPGHIKDVLRMARMEAEAEAGGQISRHNVENAIREKSRTRLTNLAVLMQTGFTWDDLVLSDESMRMLKKVCDRVRWARLVNEQWGFGRKLPYGRGLTVLLYGPPGTGKTMAAQVLANDLGRDLYRIELSQMVSKYVGETEKNLGMIFDAAKGCSAILFFDEADALFSKRTEIKDARDKYANTETSYLLQRLEEHSGISILATNNALNMDVAFKRRINYFISVEPPDEEARLRIWQSLLPGEAPFNERLDLRFFARRFELTGSEIKAVMLEAAYMAAAQNSKITHELLLVAVQDEYKKNGRVLLEADRI